MKPLWTALRRASRESRRRLCCGFAIHDIGAPLITSLGPAATHAGYHASKHEWRADARGRVDAVSPHHWRRR